MRFHPLFLALAVVGAADVHAQGLGRAPERAATPVQATCLQGSGEKRLSRLNEDYIEVRSGSGSRSVPIADIESIDMTGPVNRINRYAWATVKSRAGDVENVGIVLANAGTLVLDGTGAQGKPDSIDVLDCKRIVFKTGT